MVANVVATNGAKVYIGGLAATTVDTVTEFAALTWVQIQGVSQIGSFGDVANIITFDVIDESRTRKAKGTFDAGTMNLVMAADSGDAGQEDLIEALAEEGAYGFKVELNDALTGSGTNTIFYFRGKVASAAIEAGGANDIVRRNVTVAIDSPVLEVAAT